MVLIESKKYACETCIKGHRSSGCKHTDRPLYSIKPKGRPQSQCEHCRELRKTKQVHVKCICPKGEEASIKGLNKVLQSPAFPNGLPEALEASVGQQLLSEGMSSDSEYGSCSCMSTGGYCHCGKSFSRGAKRKARAPQPLTALSSCSSESLVSLDNQRSSNLFPTRMPEYRHVLPKPCREGTSSHHSTHPHETLYSPYGRAYDHVRPNHPDLHHLHTSYPNVTQTELSPDRNAQSGFRHPSSPYIADKFPPNGTYAFDAAEIEAWNVFQVPTSTDTSNSPCGRGDRCACPNHTSDTCPMDRETITSGACSTYPHAQPDLPPNTALSIYNDGASVVDAWIKHMGNPLSSLESPSPSDAGDLNDSSYSHPCSKNQQLPCDVDSGVINPSGSRIRTFDDLPVTFNDNELAELNSLDRTLFGFSPEYPSSLRFGNESTGLYPMFGMESLATAFTGTLQRSRSQSTSTSPSELSSSDSESSEGSVMSGEINSIYQQVGTGTGASATRRVYSAYGPSSSTSSLPTLGYF